MFNITEANTWPANVRGYQTNDEVLGGDNTDLGKSNLPLKDLTDRTKYLYDRLGRREDVAIITEAITIGASYKFKEMYISVTGNVTITIDDVATFPTGAILPIKIKCPVNKAVTFQTTSAQLIEDGSVTASKIYGCDGEDFELIAAGSFWIFRSGRGNWDKVGQDDLCRFQPRNSIIANGCNPESFGALLLRADLPRLADKVLLTAIDDAVWLSNIMYRCFWSKGNGTTTMRPPDMRAMFHRGLDLGRVIRLGQLDNTPGSYELDQLLQHNHVTAPWDKASGKASEVGNVQSPGSTDNSNTLFEYRVGGMDSSMWELARIKSVGGPENTVKNAGLLPIIYY